MIHLTIRSIPARASPTARPRTRARNHSFYLAQRSRGMDWPIRTGISREVRRYLRMPLLTVDDLDAEAERLEPRNPRVDPDHDDGSGAG